MGFMKNGTAVAPARPVGLKEWGLTKTSSVNDQEAQERLKAQEQRKGNSK